MSYVPSSVCRLKLYGVVFIYQYIENQLKRNTRVAHWVQKKVIDFLITEKQILQTLG